MLECCLCCLGFVVLLLCGFVGCGLRLFWLILVCFAFAGFDVCCDLMFAVNSVGIVDSLFLVFVLVC